MVASREVRSSVRRDISASRERRREVRDFTEDEEEGGDRDRERRQREEEGEEK